MRAKNSSWHYLLLKEGKRIKGMILIIVNNLKKKKHNLYTIYILKIEQLRFGSRVFPLFGGRGAYGS